MKPISTSVSILLRALQIICAIINFGLDMAISGMLLDATTYGDWWIYFLIVFLLTIIYLIVVLVPVCLKRVPPWVFFMTETIYMVLWLVYFAAMVAAFKSRSCSKAYYMSDTWCNLEKPVIAFGAISWLIFCLSLVLLVVFTIIPCLRTPGMHGLIAPTRFKIGALYLQERPAELTHDVELGSNTSHEGPGQLKEIPTP
ncbi:unnamed protein product [Debaryomyces tyrocola]|nr:unnamed protein product [Debaryomyces tyrocola]